MNKGQVLNRVYESRLPSRAKTVMFYLVNRSNKDLTCFPSIPTIARETGLSERTVQRALKELVAGGFLKKTSRYRENGGQSSNLYSLDIEGNCCSEEITQELADPEGEVKAEIERDDRKEGKTYNFESINFSTLHNISLFQNACHRVGDKCEPP